MGGKRGPAPWVAFVERWGGVECGVIWGERGVLGDS